MLCRPFLLALSLLLLAVGSVCAGGGDVMTNSSDHWQQYWTMWHRNNCWPEPFNTPDRAAVCGAFQADIIKGWEQQNLLGEPHFDSSNNHLSPAGMIKLRWILTQNPPEFRAPFVERGITDEITARRLAATQQGCADLMPGMMMSVAVSDMRMMSTPSDYVTGVNMWFGKFMRTIPDPQLPAFQSSSGGGGGSGSSGGAGGGSP